MVLETNNENSVMLDNFPSPYTQKMSFIKKHICKVYLCKSNLYTYIKFVYISPICILI